MGKEEENGEGKKKGGIPDELWELWEKRCARFQYVKWVQQWKPGVKVLKIIHNASAERARDAAGWEDGYAKK